MRPMIAVTADHLPLDHPGGWAFEPKFDGFRCVAYRTSDHVALQSRQQRPLARYFPEIAAGVAELTCDAVLDGELVIYRDGHLDFTALQRRIHPSASRARDLSLALPACSTCSPARTRTGDHARTPSDEWASRSC
jgi:ATP-dependent DNA ligase